MLFDDGETEELFRAHLAGAASAEGVWVPETVLGFGSRSLAFASCILLPNLAA